MEKNKQLVADLEKAKESKDNVDSKVTLIMWLMQLQTFQNIFKDGNGVTRTAMFLYWKVSKQ